MKKIATVAVMLSLFALLLTACGGGNSDGGNSALIGNWSTATIEAEGEVMPIDDPELVEAGLDALFNFSFNFKEDGTVVLTAFGVEEEMPYTVDGSTVTVGESGDTLVLNLDGDTLATADDSLAGAVITFKKA